MAVHEHEQEARDATGAVRIVVVSSTRTAGSDRTGPVVADQVRAAGFTPIGPVIVDDDATAIGAAIDGALADPGARCLLLCGGTGPSARDVTADVLRMRLHRELPAFSALFAQLSYADIGPSAILSRALGGTIGGTVVYALPGSPKACALALETLILPTLRHVVRQLDKEGPPQAPPQAPGAAADEHTDPDPTSTSPIPEGLAVLPIGGGTAPEAEPERQVGWKAALHTMGARLQLDGWPELPEAFDRNAPAREVIDGAGERGLARFEDGRVRGIYGFPDLRRDASKVLLIAEGQPMPEVVALHRHPRKAGVLVDGDAGLLPSADQLAQPISEQHTGAPLPNGGRLFAIDSGAVFVERGGRVFRWDGRAERDEGSPRAAFARLLLGWTQR